MYLPIICQDIVILQQIFLNDASPDYGRLEHGVVALCASMTRVDADDALVCITYDLKDRN